MLQRLEKADEWDVLVIGGGATGLGVAIDAVTRGYKTLLVEQEDFAKGTSSRSTKLVHGGVRYLAQGNIRLVREALRERGLLLKNAPHLAKNEAFIIPCYSWIKAGYYALGLKLYDWLSGKLSLGKSEIINKETVVSRISNVKRKRLKCGVLYHDGGFDDARLAINLAQTVVDNGGVVINYCKVTGLKKNENNKITGAAVADRESQKSYNIRAGVVVNATGIFADEVLKLDDEKNNPIIRPSQGVHIVLDRSFLQGKDALMIPKTSDGRVLFVVPWHDHALVGTTDTPLESHSPEPRALAKEIDFILNNARKYLEIKPEKKDVLAVFAGLRPLAASGGSDVKTKEISRSHKILVSKSGLITIIGGKWTTYRQMAEDTIDKAIQLNLLSPADCKTRHLRIHGYMEKNVAAYLYGYGTDAKGIENMMSLNPEWATPIAPDTNLYPAQVVWAVRFEMARTVEDVLARRTRWLFTDAEKAMEAAPAVAEIMRKEMGRDENWKNEQLKSFISVAEGYLIK